MALSINKILALLLVMTITNGPILIIEIAIMLISQALAAAAQNLLIIKVNI